ncbi:hypothetical protein M407DRAFT_16170 [Tulasnella calospora MUT 4182]|uniref:PLD phosphodiesterase domain-containing protein n=1 Tax=Tulasnella calospora MUT 4182 TaxID=1051891 RepID=A0A0C3KCE4_9AGAM|nr:hypothetical protein M407DRAFT_16170 [Tulasnella calospora MUT 4182]
MLSQKVFDLTQAKETVSSVLASDSNAKSPGEVAERLHKVKGPGVIASVKSAVVGCFSTTDPTNDHAQEDLDRAAKCGQFGEKRPSDLFLKIYHDALQTLEVDPLIGVVSPPLMGSRGVVPLSIFSPTHPDIMQHYYDTIVNAQHEVFVATNYWQVGNAASKLVAALRELSRRSVDRGAKVVVKLMYDRGALGQLKENHLLVKEEEWTAEQVKIPPRSELPGLDFEVVNYHRPVFGTFHAKYAVIDRRIALLNSNNIQDMPNMEMMIHLEGPIVDSFYDVALLSWDRALNPPLPLHKGPNADVAEPETAAGRPTAEKNVSLAERIRERNHGSSRFRLEWQHHPLTDGSKPLIPKEAGFNPYFAHSPHEECAMALVNRRPYGSPNHSDWLTPQDVAWLAGVKHAQKRIFIQTPDFNAKPIVEGVLDAARRGVECVLYICVGYNDAGEALPFQGGTNEEVVKNMYTALEDKYKHNLRIHWYTAIDQDRPINASLKKRNCHIKLMIIDDAVGIQGNGNQDAQSWYHSQEVNVMIDSPLICKEWVEGLRRSQNTHLYGEVQKDGVWRDKDGTPLPDSTGITSGPKGLIKGIQGTIARVRGTGGF